MKRVVVIGGGAAGLAAAISAAEHGAAVTVLERMDRVGKKIMASGNGRCNLSNTDLSLHHYYGDRAFCGAVFEQVGQEEVMGFFERIGLVCRVEQGRVYPLSNHASAVLDVLRLEAARRGVSVLTETVVQNILPRSDGFLLRNGKMSCDSLIVATGGKASAALGSDGSGYDILSSLGHPITRCVPALVPIKCDPVSVKGLRGVRVQARATLRLDGAPVRSETGEIQFTEYGLSGIPMFNFSSAISAHRAEAEIVLDLLPQAEHLTELLRRRDRAHLFAGMFHKQVAQAICDRAGVPSDGIAEADLPALAKVIHAFSFPVRGTLSFDHAQVTAGGADTACFDPQTMESTVVPGLYAAGEILNVHGDCGGYNLHWAWASGILAGREAAK